jgi:hypothetical protein
MYNSLVFYLRARACRHGGGHKILNPPHERFWVLLPGNANQIGLLSQTDLIGKREMSGYLLTYCSNMFEQEIKEAGGSW